jgi:hypothetical protein
MTRFDSPISPRLFFVLADVAGAAALVLQSDSKIKASAVAGILINKATSNVVKDVKKSPNKLLYVGDIGGSTQPPPPPPPPPPATGKVTFTVVYDRYRSETQWGLWRLAGGTWSALVEYSPPAVTRNYRTVTRQFADGYYSFDIHDSESDGLEAPGSFNVTAVDTNSVLQRGGPGTFKNAYSVEFEVKNGVVTRKWSGEFT